MRNYAFQSLSIYGEITIEYMVDTIAFTVENFIFAYIGICIPLMFESFNYMHAGAGILALLVSRFIAVFITGFVINRFKEKKKIPFTHLVAVAYSGLRGAVTFYLALNMTFLKEVNSSLLNIGMGVWQT